MRENEKIPAKLRERQRNRHGDECEEVWGKLYAVVDIRLPMMIMMMTNAANDLVLSCP